MPHSQRSSTRRKASVVLALAVALTTLAAWRAPFHVHLLKSVPAANATVTAAPDSIRLWFSEQPELGVTTVKVTGPNNAAVNIAPLAGRDSAVVVAPVKSKMAGGAYTVAWRTMSRDGHVARGTFGFTVSAKR
jgi:methionine-rich copper-binding protein CopC